MQVWREASELSFDKHGTSYDRTVSGHFRETGGEVEDGPSELGEVSFHCALAFHTAGPNRTDVARMVLANTYYADGARIVDDPTMIGGDWRKFLPGAGPGELAVSERHPIVG